MVLVENTQFWQQKYHHTVGEMALTDTFVKNTKNTKHTGAPAGDKHTDGGGLYLLVKAAGKYWRMNYRFADKQKTMTFGVYPAVSIVKAIQRREKARELLADGIDPNTAKTEEKQAKAAAAVNTFEAIAREWHETKASGWSVASGPWRCCMGARCMRAGTATSWHTKPSGSKHTTAQAVGRTRSANGWAGRRGF